MSKSYDSQLAFQEIFKPSFGVTPETPVNTKKLMKALKAKKQDLEIEMEKLQKTHEV